MDAIIKYPRTPHIQGSKLQEGDDGHVPFSELKGKFVVVEEKIDGANSGISFNENAELLLQSRGHFLTGGYRERHFNLLKTWANNRVDYLFDILSDRYIMYGEWMFAKHTIFYDILPHYFFEFDIYDKWEKCFLSTAKRLELLGKNSPVASVPVLWEGIAESYDHLMSLVRPSLYKSENWKQRLIETAAAKDLDPEKVVAQTNASDYSEGLYIKVEENGKTVGRYKWVRSDFLQSILDSGTHWVDRPIVPNQLAEGVNIF